MKEDDVKFVPVIGGKILAGTVASFGFVETPEEKAAADEFFKIRVADGEAVDAMREELPV